MSTSFDNSRLMGLDSRQQALAQADFWFKKLTFISSSISPIQLLSWANEFYLDNFKSNSTFAAFGLNAINSIIRSKSYSNRKNSLVNDKLKEILRQYYNSVVSLKRLTHSPFSFATIEFSQIKDTAQTQKEKLQKYYEIIQYSIGVDPNDVIDCFASILSSSFDKIACKRPSSFMIKPEHKLPKLFLELLCTSISSEDELSGHNYVLNINKPLVKYENNFYLFAPQLVFPRLDTIIRSAVFSFDEDAKSAWLNIQLHSSRQLVEEAQELLQKITIDKQEEPKESEVTQQKLQDVQDVHEEKQVNQANVANEIALQANEDNDAHEGNQVNQVNVANQANVANEIALQANEDNDAHEGNQVNQVNVANQANVANEIALQANEDNDAHEGNQVNQANEVNVTFDENQVNQVNEVENQEIEESQTNLTNQEEQDIEVEDKEEDVAVSEVQETLVKDEEVDNDTKIQHLENEINALFDYGIFEDGIENEVVENESVIVETSIEDYSMHTLFDDIIEEDVVEVPADEPRVVEKPEVNPLDAMIDGSSEDYPTLNHFDKQTSLFDSIVGPIQDSVEVDEEAELKEELTEEQKEVQRSEIKEVQEVQEPIEETKEEVTDTPIIEVAKEDVNNAVEPKPKYLDAINQTKKQNLEDELDDVEDYEEYEDDFEEVETEDDSSIDSDGLYEDADAYEDTLTGDLFNECDQDTEDNRDLYAEKDLFTFEDVEESNNLVENEEVENTDVSETSVTTTDSVSAAITATTVDTAFTVCTACAEPRTASTASTATTATTVDTAFTASTATTVDTAFTVCTACTEPRTASTASTVDTAFTAITAITATAADTASAAITATTVDTASAAITATTVDTASAAITATTVDTAFTVCTACTEPVTASTASTAITATTVDTVDTACIADTATTVEDTASGMETEVTVSSSEVTEASEVTEETEVVEYSEPAALAEPLTDVVQGEHEEGGVVELGESYEDGKKALDDIMSVVDPKGILAFNMRDEGKKRALVKKLDVAVKSYKNDLSTKLINEPDYELSIVISGGMDALSKMEVENTIAAVMLVCDKTSWHYVIETPGIGAKYGPIKQSEFSPRRWKTVQKLGWTIYLNSKKTGEKL